ncbi:hypothetical protein K469DRAFT_631952 [Zopfia rhizophila CBS 207.26]|uniref:Uncharacterized protein n=1 Tax=Zopfia rhizophila CBS 207.26 TaxID=1314779 RepID=A0A6A6E2J6_9PEZI|nr:hypothetical protein K469DRAFT_631952 [Zopfia rhizophila CBS 207.26]
MTSQYTIRFQNNTGSDSSYGFFIDPPKTTERTSTVSPFSNVWISKFIPNGGNTTITVADTFYAWVGQAPQSPGVGVTITGGQGSKVQQLGLTNTPGSSFEMEVQQNTAEFVVPNPPPSANLSSFSITTQTDFTFNDNFMLGLGQVDSNGFVVAAASVHAKPNMIYNIAPIVKFWVAQGFSVQGIIADFSAVSNQNGAIDFTSGPGVGTNTAIVTQDSTGHFSVTYQTDVKTK